MFFNNHEFLEAWGAKTSAKPRFLSPLEGFEGRNRLSQVFVWHLHRGKYRLEDPLSRLCMSFRPTGLENTRPCNSHNVSFRNCGTTAKSPRFRCSLP